MPTSFRDLSLKVKIPACIVGAVIAVAISTGSLATYFAGVSLFDEVDSKLGAVAVEKAAGVSRYLSSLEQDIKTVATSEMTVAALHAFENGWRGLGAEPKARLRQDYITANPFPTGEKDKLVSASSTNSYNEAHGRYHPWFHQFLQERGYYDIFLFDRSGNLIYTVFKELDYATNLEQGQYKDTDLGNAYRASKEAQAGQVHYFDFKPYAPSHGAPAAFLGTPITDASGGNVGVLVFQMPIDRLNQVAEKTAGLSGSGNTFLVGEDRLLRSDLASTAESEILTMVYDNEAVEAGLAGETGVTTIVADGEHFHAAYVPVEFHGTTYVVVAQELTATVMSGVKELTWKLLIVTAILIAAFALFGYWIARSITSPIDHAVDDMQSLAAGILERPVQGLDRLDEVGDIAKALEIFKTNALAAKQSEAEQERRDLAAKEQRRQDVLALADQFEKQIGEVANAVVQANVQLSQSAQDLTQSSGRANQQISAVSAATAESTIGAESIASAIGQLNAASREIAQQIEATSSATRDAVNRTQSADAQVNTLVECADKIGEIVALISEIAEQTNLLALNATIEAARAGQAGSGFTVVASEVKNLAQQTAAATDDIARQVKAIQGATGDTVTSIREIRSTIESVDNSSSTVAAAVQEQSVTVDEITRTVNDAANSSADVSERCTDMSDAAAQTGLSVASVTMAADNLKQHGDSLKSKVDSFLSQVRNSA